MDERPLIATTASNKWIDISVGFNLATVVIPQSIAYATLAGLPPHYGLCTSVLPPLCYAILGQSPHVSIGTFSLVSLMISSSLYNVGLLCNGLQKGICVGNEAEKYVNAALLLSVLVGLLQILMAALRISTKLTMCLADPVLSGFTTASACIIIGSQFKEIFGLSIANSASFFHEIFFILQHFKQINLNDLAIAVSGVIILLSLKKVNSNLPGPLLVVLGATIFVKTFQWQDKVAIIGILHGGLGTPALPHMSKEWNPANQQEGSLVILLLGPALILSIISAVLSSSVAKVFALQYHYPIQPEREFLALGVSNLLGGLFQAFPSCGSFSRSAILSSSGKMRISLRHNLITAGLVTIVAIWCTRLLYFMPKSILGAVIIVSVFSLFDFQTGKRLFWTNRVDFSLWLGAFSATLSFGVLDGLVLSILFSLAAIIYRSLEPTSIESSDETLTIYLSSLHFLNTPVLNHRIRQGEYKNIVFCGIGLHQIDSTSVRLLKELVNELKQCSQIQIKFVNCDLIFDSNLNSDIEELGFGV